jgi:hypothetical protein
MPLERYDGNTITDLESAVASVERQRKTIVQVVGNYDGAWWILTKSATRSARETRGSQS